MYSSYCEGQGPRVWGSSFVVGPRSEGFFESLPQWLAQNSFWMGNIFRHIFFGEYSTHITSSLSDDSGRVERIESSTQGFARQGFYPTKNIFIGSSGIVCQKKR